MKTIAVIITMIPILCYSQRGHNKGNHGGNNGKHFKNNSHPIAYYKESNHHHKRKGPPYWAPAHGYKHRYVFFPEYRCYYDNFSGKYIYRRGPIWVTSINLPTFMFNVSLARKIELDIDNVSQPQVYFEHHISIYP